MAAVVAAEAKKKLAALPALTKVVASPLDQIMGIEIVYETNKKKN